MEACGALWNMLLDVNSRVLVGKHGGIPLIIDGMQNHAESAEVLEQAFCVMSNLALSEQNFEAILGALNPIIAGMKQHLASKGVQVLIL